MSIVLQTKRLILKHPKLSDLDNLIALRMDPNVMQYVGNGLVQTKEEVKNFLDAALPYHQQYGFGFFSVFEKETGDFVGQAGLFHFGFDVSQNEIELAYRLHKKYWNRGFATELVKALIDWGFDHLKLKKIIAIIFPENNASRRVLEKSGFHYVKRIPYKNRECALYEVDKIHFDLDQVKLIPATLNDLPIIQNLARFYAYDISQYYGHEPGWEMEEDGLYGIGINFKEYFEDEHCSPFLIRYQNELAGFAIVDKKGTDSAVDFNMAQFFILRTYKRKGLGKYAAFYCFNHFPGEWEIMVMPGNEGAYRFWRSIIKEYTNNIFKEYTLPLEKGDRNLFRFSSFKSPLLHQKRGG